MTVTLEGCHNLGNDTCEWSSMTRHDMIRPEIQDYFDRYLRRVLKYKIEHKKKNVEWN